MYRRFVALLALAFSAAAPAQDDAFMGAFNSSQQIQSNYLSSVMGSAAVGGAAANANAARPAHRGAQAKASVPSIGTDAALKLPYRSSPEITQRLKREMIDTLAKQAPQKTGDIRKFVEEGDFVGEFDRDMASYGYSLKPSADVVDAFAAYWLCMWTIANDATPPSPAEARRVRRQVALSMGSNPTLTNADDTTRQLVAESLITEAEMALSLRDYALHNGRSTAELAENTYRNLKSKGIDLRAMHVGEEGFAKR